MHKPFDIKDIQGLSELDAAERLEADGYNELPSTLKRSLLTIILGVIREPMFLLLVACGVIYLILGSLREALMLLSFVFVVMGITLYQERRTEHALEALRDLSSPRALVIRGGREKRIAGRDVVRGDILVLSEGDRVPADAVILACTNLAVDESLLTGESVPVRKICDSNITKMERPGGDDQPFVYSGTLVVQGQGIARVVSIGEQTELGRIGKTLQTVEPEKTQLEHETNSLVKIFATIGMLLCVIVVFAYGFAQGKWLNGFLAGITLAMAILPEEFPVVLTIFLAVGAWRISQRQVLTRRVPAIESLGSATVLCVDKTGTLTVNRMSVRELYASDKFLNIDISSQDPIPEQFHELVEFSILASQRDPFDPMEKAIKQLGDRYLSETEHLHQDWDLIHEYPLSKHLLALSHVWRSPDGTDYVIAAKGAPEAIADLCHFTEKETQDLLLRIGEMADRGLRVLGVAKARFQITSLPDKQHDFHFEYLGLLGLSDPIRESVPAAIKECYQAGVRVVMITGDYPGTARHIAQEIGLAPFDSLITGPELNEMSDEELRRRIKNTNIFARVIPEQKLRLVNALKQNGEIVAMTGDGVNDAPALKAAHIGVAMGARGTDVARESSSLVLLDDDFSSIVTAIRMGRRIFDNIRKAVAYIFAIHIPIAGLSLLQAVFKWPLILMPVHIVFLEFIIDPACTIIFEAEPEEKNIMNRPPYDPTRRLFGSQTLSIGLFQGLSVLLIVVGVFLVSMYRGQGEIESRALTFTTLIIANFLLILTNRSWSLTILRTLRSPNAAQWWVIGGATVLLILVLYVPFLRDLFRFSFLHFSDILICLLAGFAGILWFEIFKMAKPVSR